MTEGGGSRSQTQLGSCSFAVPDQHPGPLWGVSQLPATHPWGTRLESQLRPQLPSSGLDKVRRAPERPQPRLGQKTRSRRRLKEVVKESWEGM